MRLLMLWASLGSSSFRIRSITERAHTIQIWILTSVCSRRTWQRRHWWRRYSFITLQCETRCCRENRYRIPSWSYCAPLKSVMPGAEIKEKDVKEKEEEKQQ